MEKPIYLPCIIGYNFFLATKCFGKVDQGQWVAAISEDLWNKGSYKCGQWLNISCVGTKYPCLGNGKIIKVKIVDYWVAPDINFIAISKEALSTIADPNAGPIPIQFY